MNCEIFGKIDGKDVKKYTLSNGLITVEILTYGGVVRSIIVPDKNGKNVDVALGYNSLEEYTVNDGYLGALIGRVGNRIENGTFKIKRKEFKVSVNDNGNSLHGGINGFNKKIWNDKIDGETLILSLFSPDGEEGYPSNLEVTVKYFLLGKSFNIEYFASSDGLTPINLTNHTYFNLSGEGNGNILDTKLKIKAKYITPVDNRLIPHGEYLKVFGSPFDFNEFKKIGEEIDLDDEVLYNCGGYDVNFVLDGKGYRKVAEAISDKTGIKMNVLTDQKGIQFYSGNFIKNLKGKNGIYNKRDGFCLETQNFPNAVNCRNYPNCLLKKGKTYHTITTYEFE